MTRAQTLTGLFALLLLIPQLAHADEPRPATNDVWGDLWSRDSLSGNWNGWRDRWTGYGAVLAADSIDEVVGNASGGVRQTVVYSGRFELVATVDLAKLLGWDATLHANGYWTHGRSLSSDALAGNFMTVSNIEATPSMRLFDLWIEQLLFDGRLSVRAGQIAADDEFFSSDTASSFSNSTFGWPAILGADLPSGGPVYDIATPGIRFKYAPLSDLSLSLALFDGDPANPGPGDPQKRDNDGLTFRTNGGAFVMAEAAYKTNVDLGSGALPLVLKAGAWFHSSDFGDEHFDSTGRSLASPASSGVPASQSGDYGGYLIADQVVWQKAESPDTNIAAFVRIAGAPADRNLISFYADTGIAFRGLVAERPNDTFGLAFAFAQVSPAASALDRDRRMFHDIATPVRNYEATVEVTYHLQLNQWWALQPDVQYVMHPAGNVAKPASTTAIPDALILGLRSSIVI